MNHARGLDSLRAVCALIVVMSHFGGPPIAAGIDKSTRLGYTLNGGLNNIWNGVAAVIAFFVISGFCIHFPYAASRRIPSLMQYAVRRYIRIGVPLLAAIGITALTGEEFDWWGETSILWSLVAEMIYYAIYPALLMLRRRGFSWKAMVIAAFAAALLVASSKPDASRYPSFGNGLNWLLGLPCWLLGCMLAENCIAGRLSETRHIGLWRLAVWSIATILSIMTFHSPIGPAWTLNFFAILVAFWLAREIVRCRTVEPYPWLEWAGTWSYSLYLLHALAYSLYLRIRLPNLGYFLNWTMQMAFILGVCFAFSLAVERPAHWCARMLSRKFRPAVNSPCHDSTHPGP